MKYDISSKVFGKSCISVVLTIAATVNIGLAGTTVNAAESADAARPAETPGATGAAKPAEAPKPADTARPADAAKTENVQPVSSTAFTDQAAVRPKEWRFQNEQEWIVDAVGRDIVEMLGYAKYSKDGFSAKDVDFSTKTVDLDKNSYSYKYSIKCADSPSEYNFSLTDYAWSPANYEPLAKQLIEKLKLSSAAPLAVPDDFLKNVAKADFDSLFAENKRISKALSENPLDPSLHEQAAMLQAVFAMMEYCASFSDTRAPLNRMCAHLTLARALNGDKLSTCGQIANIALESLSCRDGIAVPMSEEMEKQPLGQTEKSILRALKIRGTSNYRFYAEGEATPLEENQWGLRFSQTRGTQETMEKVMAKHHSLPIEWMRIMNAAPGSVQTGHLIEARLVSAEIADFIKSYNAYKNNSPGDLRNLYSELNLESNRCLTSEAGVPSLTVLSWEDVAAFHSRHLANAVCEEYMFNSRMFSVKELAKQTQERAVKVFGKLYIFPLVKARFNMEEPERDKFFEDFQNLVVSHPQLITSHNWMTILSVAQRVSPKTNLLPAEVWFNPPMPMGTVFYNRQELKNNKKDLAELTEYRRLSPYSPTLCEAWALKKYGEKPTSDQLREAFGRLVEYDVNTMERISYAEELHPDKYIPLLEKVAKEDPKNYWILGDYCVVNNRPEQAAKYYELGVNEDQDDVRIANCCDWLIRYRFDHGHKEKARELAQFAAEVYSRRGLMAQARLFERDGDLKGAEEDFRKIQERYENEEELTAFLLRNASKNPAYAEEGRRLSLKFFPMGMRKASLADFKGKPTEGMKVTADQWGIDDPVVKKEAIIVAINGYAVANTKQADIARHMATSPVMKLIVWDGNQYKEAERTTVNLNALGITYEALKPTLDLGGKDPQKALDDLTRLRDNMMKQAIEMEKQNLPPAEALKRLFKQNNIPGSMYENLLKQNMPQIYSPAKAVSKPASGKAIGRTAAGGAKSKAPSKSTPKRK